MRRAALSGAVAAAWLAACPAQAVAAEPGHGALDTPAITVASLPHVMLTSAALAGDRVVAAGEHGVVILSDDDGKTWRQAAVPVNLTLTAIAFATPSIGYAAGHFGTVLRTDDGGVQWRLLMDGLRIPALMLAAAGDDAHAQRLSELTAKDGPDKPLMVLDVVSADQMRAFGASGLAITTEDGGAHWRDISRHMADPKALNIYGIARSGDGAVLAAGEQGLLAFGMLDQGLQPVASPYAGSFFGVLPLPGDRTLLFGLLGHAFVASDNASVLRPVTHAETATLNAAVLLADGTALLGDLQGRIWRLAAPAGQPPSLVATPMAAPWPVVALVETRRHTLLAFGPGGVLQLGVPPPLTN